MRIYLTLFLFLSFSFAYGQQLNADAGQDTVFCDTAVPDSLELGGAPSASGGSNVYVYNWDIFPKPYIPYPAAPNIKFYCTDFLNDTTLANPSLITGTLPFNTEELIFVLTVTDDSGQVAIDSISILRAVWIFPLGTFRIFTFPGDTQTISPAFGGGLEPYILDWGPSDSIIGNRYDYNVYNLNKPTRQVIIPDGLSEKHYNLTVTGLHGCTKVVGMYEWFQIWPVSAQSMAEPINTVSLFPNPAKNHLIASSSNKEISSVVIRDLSGSVVLVPKISSIPIKIDLRGLSNGMYFVTLGTSSGIMTKKIFKIGY